MTYTTLTHSQVVSHIEAVELFTSH